MEVPFLTITLPLHIANIISLRRSSFFETFSSKKISRDVSLCSNHHFSGARFDCGHASSDRLQVRRRAEGKKKKRKKEEGKSFCSYLNLWLLLWRSRAIFISRSAARFVAFHHPYPLSLLVFFNNLAWYEFKIKKKKQKVKIDGVR